MLTSRRSLLWLTLLIVLLLNVSLLILAVINDESSQFRLVFLDVGQGDAIFIETPAGRQVLVDAGPNRAVLSGLGKELGLWDRSLDIVIATHPDQDHIGGFPEIFRRYQVDYVLDNGEGSDTEIFTLYRNRIQTEGAIYREVSPGWQVDLGDETTITVLGASQGLEETNDNSIVLRLDHADHSVLLMGDASADIEQGLLLSYPNLLNTDLLKVGHHGSRTSSSLSFIHAVSPDYAVISAGQDNRYGHPHREVISNLLAARSKILQTATEGDIEFIFREDEGLILDTD